MPRLNAWKKAFNREDLAELDRLISKNPEHLPTLLTATHGLTRGFFDEGEDYRTDPFCVGLWQLLRRHWETYWLDVELNRTQVYSVIPLGLTEPDRHDWFALIYGGAVMDQADRERFAKMIGVAHPYVKLVELEFKEEPD